MHASLHTTYRALLTGYICHPIPLDVPSTKTKQNENTKQDMLILTHHVVQTIYLHQSSHVIRSKSKSLATVLFQCVNKTEVNTVNKITPR